VASFHVVDGIAESVGGVLLIDDILSDSLSEVGVWAYNGLRDQAIVEYCHELWEASAKVGDGGLSSAEISFMLTSKF
jgi:hypothetical protein